ncbi:dynein axonemal heavy chain 11-like [Numenius arquata]|uniref:dynein axonemal heavy chain 11-like n=1 Tax=Numenius arquata TaxID=31919 RepID=UPI003D30968D
MAPKRQKLKEKSSLAVSLRKVESALKGGYVLHVDQMKHEKETDGTGKRPKLQALTTALNSSWPLQRGPHAVNDPEFLQIRPRHLRPPPPPPAGAPRPPPGLLQAAGGTGRPRSAAGGSGADPLAPRLPVAAAGGTTWDRDAVRDAGVLSDVVEPLLPTIQHVRLLVAEGTTLTDLLELQLHKVEDEVQHIVDNAVKELRTEKILAETSQAWAAMEFSKKEHHRNRAPLLKSDEQLLETLDNNQVQLQMILKSKYVAYLIEQVKGWQNKLNMADCVISIWMEVQHTWSHLESIFTDSEDSSSQSPEDANRFDEINRRFKVACHFTKLFDNIADAKFQEHIEESVSIALGMYSREKEVVPVYVGCGCSGQGESWLQHLEETVHESVRPSIKEVILACEEKQREQWGFDYPAQVALGGSQIWWFSDVETAFFRLEEGSASALKGCRNKQVTQLNALISLLFGELSLGEGWKIMTICTIDVHTRGVVASPVAQKLCVWINCILLSRF